MFRLRKLSIVTDEIHHDGGPHLDRPLLRGAVAAVLPDGVRRPAVGLELEKERLECGLEVHGHD